MNYFNSKDTICAISTGGSISAIAVIRISGVNAIEITNSIFSKDILNATSHTIHYGNIIYSEEIIDEVLVSIFRDNKSYTGEESVEISCHGSIYIQNKITQILINKGCRSATAGEFTMRAFKNGKLDLSQAESVADLISSESKAAHQTALNNLRGGFSNKLEKLRQQLIDFASLIELELDFSEEDVEFADRKQFDSLLKKIHLELKMLVDSFNSGNVLKNGVSVAIAGKPNAGKSSLLNTLLKEDKAIVSEIPGTTRDSIEDSININGIKFRFIDTAGLRETKDVIESKGIIKTKEKIRNSQFLIFLFDINDTTIDEIENTLKDFERKDLKIILVRNKTDLKIKNFDLQKKLMDRDVLEICAIDFKSVSVLKDKLFKEINIHNSSNNVVLSNSRHLEALNKALKAINEVQIGLKKNLSVDLLSIDIKRSIEHIGEITGEITNDEILGNIFSKFCIGK